MRDEWGNPFAPLSCELAAVEDIRLQLAGSEIGARVYKPTVAGSEPQPALVFYHGGGFVLGNLELYDTVCRQLARLSRCMVVSIDYVLAPQQRILQIHEQGFAAYQWVLQNAERLGIDGTRIAIAGDSAGGNLAIAVTLACKRESVPMPAYQVLIYP
ncbi:MAG: alpha/beta hydrolase, partial [Gammaproteobacteria bacterium]